MLTDEAETALRLDDVLHLGWGRESLGWVQIHPGLSEPFDHSVIEVRMIVAMEHRSQAIGNDFLRYCLMLRSRIVPAKTDEYIVLTDPLLEEIRRLNGKCNDRRLQPAVFQHLDKVCCAIAGSLYFSAQNNLLVASDCFIYQFMTCKELNSSFCSLSPTYGNGRWCCLMQQLASG